MVFKYTLKQTHNTCAAVENSTFHFLTRYHPYASQLPLTKNAQDVGKNLLTPCAKAPTELIERCALIISRACLQLLPVRTWRFDPYHQK
jgi:hypothetical protein